MSRARGPAGPSVAALAGCAPCGSDTVRGQPMVGADTSVHDAEEPSAIRAGTVRFSLHAAFMPGAQRKLRANEDLHLPTPTIGITRCSVCTHKHLYVADT